VGEKNYFSSINSLKGILMPMKEITKYVVYHKVGGTTMISLYHEAGPASELKSLSTEEAAYLVELLRYTKPVYYDDTTGMIQTNYEDTGKGIRR
jgi:hypothetical protein